MTIGVLAGILIKIIIPSLNLVGWTGGLLIYEAIDIYLDRRK